MKQLNKVKNNIRDYVCQRKKNLKKYFAFKQKSFSFKVPNLYLWDWFALLNNVLILIFSFLISYYFLTQEILKKFSNTGQESEVFGISLLFCCLSIFALAFYIHRKLNLRLLLKLLIAYILYLLTAYGLLITRNLNNEKFKVENFAKNYIFQLEPLLVIVLILGLSYLLSYIFKKVYSFKKYDFTYLDDISPSWIMAGLMIPTLAKEQNFLNYAFGPFGAEVLIEQEKFFEVLSVTSGLLFLNSFLLFLAYYFFFNTLSDIKVNRASFSLVVTTSLILSFAFNYTFQLGVRGDADLLGQYIFPGATSFQVIFLFIACLIIYMFLNRYILSTSLIIFSGVAISVVNMMKQDMRSEPLLITDFVWLQEPSLLISFISKSALTYTMLSILLFIGVYLFMRKKIFVGKLIIRKRVRFTVLATLLTVFLGVFNIFKNDQKGRIVDNIPIVSTLNNWNDITWFGFTTNARYKSLMYVWIKQITKTIMDKPSDYNQSKIEILAQKYAERAREINEKRKESLSDQTVIYVLSESLANPNRLSNVTLSSPALPLISQIQSETTSGLMRSNGYGGGTANMEFQSLTGLPMTNYSQNVAILYSEVAPKMSVFPSISDQFDAENRFVIHPAGANNYNRKNIYNRLGFGHMIFSENTNEKISNPERVGLSISDETVYRNILEKIDTSKSQFFSTLTMQNHAPWSVDYPVEVTATGRNFSEQENINFTEYARLLTYTDGATKDFLDSLKNINKKITVVFYGDHLPGFYPISSFKEEPEKQYQTDYFIWSNYQTKKLDYPIVGSSDFIAELLEHTDSKVTPYQALLTDVLETKKSSSLTKEQEQTLEDLKLVQYDISVGNGYLRNDKQFFSAN